MLLKYRQPSPWAMVLLLLSVASPGEARRRTPGAQTASAGTAGRLHSSSVSQTESLGTPPARVAADVCIVPDRVTSAMTCPAVHLSARAHEHTPADGPSYEVYNHETPAVPQVHLMFGVVPGPSNRAEDLIRREAGLVSQLVQTTPVGNPQRPDTMMRLAMDLEELALMQDHKATGTVRLDEIDALRRYIQGTAGVVVNHPSAQPVRPYTLDEARARLTQLQTEITHDEEAARAYRVSLAQVYEALRQAHPNYARMDEVLFSLAQVHEALHEDDAAREAYRALIQQYPQSVHVPGALVSFGDFFFDHAMLSEARQFYEMVIQRGSADNRAYGYALYKLAWVHYNTSDFPHALTTFYTLIDYGMQNPTSSAGSPGFLRSVRPELVKMYGAVYGTLRSPLVIKDALDTFQHYSDQADPKAAFTLLEQLGELYFDNGQWANTIVVYHKLMADQQGTGRLCYWQSQVTKATIAWKPAEQTETEIENLLAVYQHDRQDSSKTEEQRTSCRDGTAQVMFEVAVHLHAVATGINDDGTVRSTAERTPAFHALVGRVERLYKLLLQEFPDLDQVAFPALRREDWPTRYRVAMWRADLVFQDQRMCECGPAYDELLDLNPQAAEAEDAGWRALVCWDGCFRAQEPVDSLAASGTPTSWDPRELSVQEQGITRAYTRYLCSSDSLAREGSPDTTVASSGTFGAGESLASLVLQVRFARASVYFHARRFEESAAMYREIIETMPALPQAPTEMHVHAAKNYLDSLTFMATRWEPARPACLSNFEAEAQFVRGKFCAGTPGATVGDLCSSMDRLECDVLNSRASALQKSGHYRDAADAYRALMRDHVACRTYLDAPIIASNMADAASAAGDLREAMSTREKLVQMFLDSNHAFAVRALWLLAQNCVAVQVFDCAAERFEQFSEWAIARPEAAHAVFQQLNQLATANGLVGEVAAWEQRVPDALRQAMVYRIALGTRENEQRAMDDARLFSSTFGTNSRYERIAAQIQFAMGGLQTNRALRIEERTTQTTEQAAARTAELRASWLTVVQHYESFARRVARTHLVDQQMLALAALGRTHWKRGDHAQALIAFERLVTDWTGHSASSIEPDTSPAPGEIAIRAGYANAAEMSATDLDATIMTVKESVAEARFYLAEMTYQRFISRPFPAYHGGRSMTAFTHWYDQTLKSFFEQQLHALDHEAKPRYDRVAAMKIPEWQMAAASRLGSMYLAFAQLLRKAPDPPALMGWPEALDEYHIHLDEMAQRYLDRAQSGFEHCRQLSAEIHWFNRYSAECDSGLHEIDRRQYPLRDEVVRQPGLLVSRPTNARPFYTTPEAPHSASEEIPNSP